MCILSCAIFFHYHKQSISNGEVYEYLKSQLPIRKWRHDNYVKNEAPKSSDTAIILNHIEANHGVQVVAGAMLGYLKSAPELDGANAFTTSLLRSPDEAGLQPVSEAAAGTGGAYAHYTHPVKEEHQPMDINNVEAAPAMPMPSMNELDSVGDLTDDHMDAAIHAPIDVNPADVLTLDPAPTDSSPIPTYTRGGKAKDVVERNGQHYLAARLTHLEHVSSQLYLLNRREDTPYPFERVGCSRSYNDVEAFVMFPRPSSTKRNAAEVLFYDSDVRSLIDRKRGDNSFEEEANTLGDYTFERFVMDSIAPFDKESDSFGFEALIGGFWRSNSGSDDGGDDIRGPFASSKELKHNLQNWGNLTDSKRSKFRSSLRLLNDVMRDLEASGIDAAVVQEYELRRSKLPRSTDSYLISIELARILLEHKGVITSRFSRKNYPVKPSDMPTDSSEEPSDAQDPSDISTWRPTQFELPHWAKVTFDKLTTLDAFIAEYSEGTNGRPPLKMIEEYFGAGPQRGSLPKWRSFRVRNTRKYDNEWCNRKQLYAAIDRGVTKEALLNIVAVHNEELHSDRANHSNGKLVRWLMRYLKEERNGFDRRRQSALRRGEVRRANIAQRRGEGGGTVEDSGAAEQEDV